jgi:carotenoid cleavage dioxygenase
MRFPDLPIYTGFNTPGRTEADIFDLEIDGDLPSDIDGTFYRVAPDPQFPPRLGSDIYFNGDGMVFMFRFKDGHVDYKSRYVQTDKWKLEHEARKALFGAYRNPYTDDPSVAGQIRGTANTNIMFHGGKLLALKEDSPPVAMDPHTLETTGNWYFDGKLTSKTFTAHPKIDPHTGEMVCFGYSATGEATPDVAYYLVDANGKITHETWFKVPYACMIHDFAVTRDYVVFPIVPLIASHDRIKNGESHFAWDGSKDVFMGVLPRNGEGKDIRWVRGPTHFTSHIMNAFNDGRKIYIDAPVSESSVFPFFPDVTGAEFNREKGSPRLTRYKIDLESNEPTIEREQLTPLIGEMPRCDDRYAMEHYRYGYMGAFDPKLPFDLDRTTIAGLFFNVLARHDHATGKSVTAFAGPTGGFQEPVFIPRRKDAPEGDGYLAALVNRYDEHRSDLAIIDAQTMERIATVKLPLRLRPGLHGNWVPAAALPSEPERPAGRNGYVS